MQFTARGKSPIETKTFEGKSGVSYIFFRSDNGNVHVFAEVNVAEAARDCGATGEGNTHSLVKEIWP
jgi:hypothetical protein